MRRTEATLAAIVTALFAGVWVITQQIVSPPVSVGPTMVLAAVTAVLAIVGYGSLLRRRRRGGLATAAIEAPAGDVITAVSDTLPYLRHGLTADTADTVAEVLLPIAGGRAVVLADTNEVVGSAGERLVDAPELRRRVVRRAELATEIRDDEFLVCAALRSGSGQPVGTLTVVFTTGGQVAVSRVASLAQLLSIHIELSEATEQAQLAADAKLHALRAQINPHFLFNTLNTIASKSRTSPDEARALLQRLADFFRYALRQDDQFADFSNEYFFVRTYIALEQARYDDRLTVVYDIDPQVLSAQVPVLTIQPLVENSVKHGLAPRDGGGVLTLKARVDPLGRAVAIEVRDDGVGMSAERLAALATGQAERSGRSGVGVANIRERLDRLFGDRYRMEIRSTLGEGTTIRLDLPLGT